MKLINPQHGTGERIAALARQFAGGDPFSHLVIDNFLDEAFARSLVQEFPDFHHRDYRHVNELGYEDKKAVHTCVKELSPAFRRMDELISSPEFLHYASGITGIEDLLYDPEYLGGGTHENLNHHELSTHVDFNYHRSLGLHRRISAILYLNEEWMPGWGGDLELHKDPWLPRHRNSIKTIAPIFNRLVLFPTTEYSWHGFTPIKIPAGRPGISRKSFAFFLYSRDRPAHEIRALHGTIYCERPLPENLKAGNTLSQADVDEIERLTIRRDGLLQLMYAREAEYSALTGTLRTEMHHFQKKVEHLDGMTDAVEQMYRFSINRAMEAVEPLQLAFHGGPHAEVISGYWRDPFLFRRCKLEVTKLTAPPREGDLLLFLDLGATTWSIGRMRRELGKYFVVHQQRNPQLLVLPKDRFYGTVTSFDRAAAGHRGLSPASTEPYPAALKRKERLIIFYFRMNSLKNRLIGKRKSKLLWILSVGVRGALERLGIRSAVLWPEEVKAE